MMTMKSWPLALMAALTISACQTTGPDAPMTAAAPVADMVAETVAGDVLFAHKVIDKGGYCTVGFTVTYPADIAPHSRKIRSTILWSGDQLDYAFPIPPRGSPDRFVANQDGTVTFTGAVADSIDPCSPEMAARTLAIGPCAEGGCAPARYVPDSAAADLGLVEADY